MAHDSSRFSNRRALAVLLVILLATCAVPQLAAQTLVQIEGRVQDADGDPVAGARVVYRLVDSEGVFISPPTDGSGQYALEMPDGERCRPVAVIDSGGTRIELGEVDPARVTAGMSQQITIEVPRRWNPSAVVQNFPGSDRLFRSFVEDTAITERYRLEAQVRREEGDSIDRGLLSVIGSAQFESIPNVEFGARLSAVGVNTTSGSGGDGMGDTDLWAKYSLGPTSDNRHELAFGVAATIPTGSDADGAGYDSTASRMFVAGRREVPWGVLTGNLNVTFNGDGRIFGLGLSGQTSLGVNVGVIAPVSYRLAVIGEAGFQGERFSGFDDETVVLGGVNLLLKDGSLRGAVGLGLSDGSPDVEIILGYSIPF
ncbi:MAG: hypothetical protein GTN89_13210 [Acidobacteria bacterium]|nr:hypothetical protein [Acidobacteriota bacterium]NIM60205.1 hypothetical protein [Acidobacteriota bacterium]NIO60243.1 hypothetical protein [Acidobacteriota bacterium]NIQ31298.1 hypothetical protein [Acidobacteriota bacterium]NIQ86521.1 hypothetical protein [Acidobacteriota bacterium]